VAATPSSPFHTVMPNLPEMQASSSKRLSLRRVYSGVPDPDTSRLFPRRHSEPASDTDRAHHPQYVQCSIFPHLVHRLSSRAIPLCLEAQHRDDNAAAASSVTSKPPPQPACRTDHHHQKQRHSDPGWLPSSSSSSSSPPPPVVTRRASKRARVSPAAFGFVSIGAADLDRAQAFYELVFRWVFPDEPASAEQRLFFAATGEGAATIPIGGLFHRRDDGGGGGGGDDSDGPSADCNRLPVVGYVRVDDIDDALSLAEAGGGTVVQEKWLDGSRRADMATFTNIEGNLVGLIHPVVLPIRKP